MIEAIEIAIKHLRQSKPMILSLTNFVTMDFIANCLLALGAAPIMSVSSAEVEELAILCSAIHINIGTLDDAFIARVREVLQWARKYNKPIVLDPVGAGATKARTAIAQECMQHAAIVRGNASEMIALSAILSKTKGVESVNTTQEAKSAALNLARNHNFCAVVSGSVDFITDGIKQSEVPYGSSLMSLVTGMGCALTAVIAAFKATISDSFAASLIATQYFTLCGEVAAKNAYHPGTFRTHFIDALHAADYNNLSKLLEK